MKLILTDRIARRLEKEGLSDATDWERIYEEQYILAETQRHIDEARRVLRDDWDDW